MGGDRQYPTQSIVSRRHTSEIRFSNQQLAKMTEVTKDMILDYLVKKGGVVKNVDLVRHFRKYLQVENPGRKGMRVDPYLTMRFLPRLYAYATPRYSW